MAVRKSYLLALVIVLFLCATTLLSGFLGLMNQRRGHTGIDPGLPAGVYRVIILEYQYGKSRVIVYAMNKNPAGHLVTISMNDSTFDEIWDSIYGGRKGMKALMVLEDNEIYNWTYVEDLKLSRRPREPGGSN